MEDNKKKYIVKYFFNSCKYVILLEYTESLLIISIECDKLKVDKQTGKNIFYMKTVGLKDFENYEELFIMYSHPNELVEFLKYIITNRFLEIYYNPSKDNEIITFWKYKKGEKEKSLNIILQKTLGDESTNKKIDENEIVCEFLINDVKLSTSKKYHAKKIFNIVPLNDGRISTCSNDKSIIIYNADTLEKDFTIFATDFVNYLENIDNKLERDFDVTTLGACGIFSIFIYKVIMKDHELIKTIKNAHSDYIRKITLANNQNFASCSSDLSIKIWNTNGESTYPFVHEIKTEHVGNISSILLVNEHYIVSGNSNSLDKKMYFWDCNNSYKKVATIDNVIVPNSNSMVDYENENKLIVGDIGLVYVINYLSYEIENQIKCSNFSDIYSLGIFDDNNIFLGDKNSKFGLFYYKSLKVSDVISSGIANPINSIVPFNKNIFVAKDDGEIIKYKL